MNKIRGFSLLEVMVVMAIMAILMGFAIISYRDPMIRTRLGGAVDDIDLLMDYALVEASRTSTGVLLCPQDGSDWANGWYLEYDVDGNRGCPNSLATARDQATTAGEVFYIGQPLGQGFVVTPANIDGVLFTNNPDIRRQIQVIRGGNLGLSNFSFTFALGDYQKRIVASSGGRIRVEDTTRKGKSTGGKTGGKTK